MMSHKTVLLVLLALSVVHPSTSIPLNLFAGIANFLEGIRYVPPQTGIFSATAATTSTTTATPEYIVEKKEVVVFNESGWLQPAGSNHRYLMSTEPMDWFTAKYWCIGEGGFLAEIKEKEQQEEVEQLVGREGGRNYWLGLEHGWERWYTSRTSLEYKGWASFPSGDQDRCAAMLAREGYRWDNWNCHDQYEQKTGREFRALCQKDVEQDFNAVEDIKYTATKQEDKSNMTTCSMADIRLQGGGWIDRYEGVTSAEKCHSLCLAKNACRFWTWRGDNRGQRCFLKEKEGRTVTKSGAFSGTTSHNLGCNQPLVTRESRSETCACVPVQNLVQPGYINPRLAPDVASLLNGKDSSNPTPRLAPDVGALLNGEDSSKLDDTTPGTGRIVNRPDIGDLLNGRQDSSNSGSGRVCPSGFTLLCTDQDEQNEGDILLSAKKTTSRPDFHPSHVHKVTTSRPVSTQLRISACVVNDVRMSGFTVVSTLEGVSSHASCHAHCLSNTLCNYWSWGGNTRGDTCLMSKSEGKVVRRAGAVSGTVRKDLDCHHPLVTRESRMETCACVPVENLVQPGYINPRLAPDSSKRQPRVAPDIGALLNGEDFSKLDDPTPGSGRILTGHPDIGDLLNGRQDASTTGNGRVCPSGFTLLCTDQDEQKEKVTTSRPDFHPSYVHTVTTSRPISTQLRISACVVNDVRMSGFTVVSTLEGVSSHASCHAHCLSNTLCNYWSWGGNAGGDTCLMSKSEGRVVRRAGAVSGTVRKDLDCHHPVVSKIPEEDVSQCRCQGRNRQPKQDLTGIVNPRESPRGRIVNIDFSEDGCPPCEEEWVVEKKEAVEVVCSCRFDPTQDLVGNGKIHPRKLQRGRIVNEKPQQESIVNQKVDQIECPAGFTLDCEEFEEGSGEEAFLEWTGPEHPGKDSYVEGSGLVGYGELSSLDYFSAPRVGRSQKDSSAVSFPKA